MWGLHGETDERRHPRGADPPVLTANATRTSQRWTRIYDALIKAADRASCLIALGGGVVGDITGFAAATFLRGIPVVQMPTTLWRRWTARSAEKTGVNHPLGKNLIGAPSAAGGAGRSVLLTTLRGASSARVSAKW